MTDKEEKDYGVKLANKEEKDYGALFGGSLILLIILSMLTCFGTGIWGFIRLIMYWTAG